MPNRIPILQITDGTTDGTVDLINPHGFHLYDWTPATSAAKNDGVWQDSPIADGRQLVAEYDQNVIETFELKAWGPSPDGMAQELQELRRLLKKARNYWKTSWQDDPVWLVARARGETNTRYALIHSGRLPHDDNYYAQPFLQPRCRVVLDDLILVIERGDWLETAPGTATAVSIGAVESYGGRNLGNVDSTGATEPTTADEVFVTNKRAQANITHVHYWDSAGAAWSANLMNAALPYDLLPNPVAAGDVIVFGIDTTLADSGPFSSLVLDIGTVQVDLTTITWRYSDAAADPTGWQALTVQDNTNADGDMTGDAFDTAGVAAICWEVPSVVAWQTQDPQVGAGAALGVTGYWVAAHVVAVGAAPTPPTQQNRDIYAVAWPYIEIAAAQVGGDFSSLARLLIHNQSDDDDGNGSPALDAKRVLAGLRTYDRGADFTAYLNISDEQNPAFVTAAATGAGAFVTATEAPSGRCIEVTNAGAAWAEFGSLSLAETHAYQFYGRHRMFLRGVYLSGATTGVTLRVYYGTLSTTLSTYTREVALVGGSYPTLDMGEVSLPPGGRVKSSELGLLHFRFEVFGDGAADFRVYDMILLPVDEWAIDSYSTVGAVLGSRQTDTGGGRYLEIDSITFPRYDIRSLLRGFSDDYVLETWANPTNRYAMLQANVRQRLWFLSTLGDTTNFSRNEITHSLRVSRQQRYSSMRGER